MKNALLIFSIAITTVSATAAEHADSISLPEVTVVSSAKTRPELLPLDVDIITSTEINRSAESSLMPVLTDMVPGLFVSERGFAGYGVSGGAAGTVNIRGVGQGNKVLFMIDGQPQWAAVFGHALPDTYVANGVERIEIVKGPSSLLYGSSAMGGSVNIITRRQNQDGLTGRARAMFGSFNTQKFNLSTGFRKGKLSGVLAGQLDRSNGNRERSAFWLANEYMNINYAASGNWSAGANVDLTQTRAENPGTVQSPLLDMWTYMFRGAASVYANDRYSFGDGGVQAYINWGRHNVDDGYAPGATPRDYLFHSDDYNMGFTLYQTLHPWQNVDLSAGLDFVHWGGKTWNTDKATEAKTEGVDKSENEVAGYVMLQQGLWGERLSLNAGVRLQHGSQYGNIWVPQAGFILRPVAASELKFSFSKGFRAPNLRELYMYVPANPDLKPEEMLNYEVAYRHSFLDRRLTFGMALFFIDGKNMIQTESVDGRMKNMNTGSFINKGFEAEAAFRINSLWHLAANYSYLHTSNSNLLSAPKNKLNVQLDFTPGALQLTLSSNSIWSLHTGAPEGKTTSYELLNLRAAYTLRKGMAHVTPFIKLDNITDSHYEIVYGCPMPGCTILGGVEISF